MLDHISPTLPQGVAVNRIFSAVVEQLIADGVADTVLHGVSAKLIGALIEQDDDDVWIRACLDTYDGHPAILQAFADNGYHHECGADQAALSWCALPAGHADDCEDNDGFLLPRTSDRELARRYWSEQLEPPLVRSGAPADALSMLSTSYHRDALRDWVVLRQLRSWGAENPEGETA
jgi:hypothetical protein